MSFQFLLIYLFKNRTPNSAKNSLFVKHITIIFISRDLGWSFIFQFYFWRMPKFISVKMKNNSLKKFCHISCLNFFLEILQPKREIPNIAKAWKFSKQSWERHLFSPWCYLYCRKKRVLNKVASVYIIIIPCAFENWK